MRNDRQPIIVECIKCRTKFPKITAGSGGVTSLRFPVYQILRYKDFDSGPPREINLCSKCSDKLDKFLFIYDYDGVDYYQDMDELEEKINNYNKKEENKEHE